MTDADDSHRPRPSYVQNSASKTAEPRRELFFERLPEPWTEDVQEPEIPPAEQIAGEPGIPPGEQQRPEAEEPSLYFRHARTFERTFDSPLPAKVAQGLPPIRQSLTRPAAPTAPSVAPPAPSTLHAQVRASSADVSVPERPKQSSGPVPVAPRDSDFAGDPKPAAARVGGIQRSRPARPSGQVAAAGTSGEFPAARNSGSVPAARISDALSVARSSGAMPAVARSSREVPVAVPPERAASASAAYAKDSGDVQIVRDDSGTQVAATQRPGRQRKGKAVTGMALASLALVAYAFQIGSMESAADAAASQLTAGNTALATLLPWLLVVPAVLLFGLIVWLLAGIIGLRRTATKTRRPREDNKSKTPLNQFKSAALRQGVENRTAYRGWRLLEAACGSDQPITLDSYLAEDLALSPREVRGVHLQLLTDLSRHSDPSMRLPLAETVLDLLKAVDAAPVARPASTSGEVVIPGDPGQRKRKSAASS